MTYGEVELKTNKNTSIVFNNNRSAEFWDLKVGQIVKIFYESEPIDSQPLQATAAEIKIIKYKL
ncbi:DUF3221 domain-containing protein [Bacillus sp. DJP31]|uniref:DUF3221 domain-containing protein n=1 Tax=Bacillus sp. DJP31 TaxID=3409789 RepID=UPI003BB7C8F6